eukprot:Skav212195  [mRNA]  locus=scaffold754:599424:601623:- [translate_table: standard]
MQRLTESFAKLSRPEVHSDRSCGFTWHLEENGGAIGGDNVATFEEGNAPPKESLAFFADEVLYEDFNYELPLRGKGEVGDFLEKFAKIKALKFVAERFSDGGRACCFTWNVEIVGASADAPRIRGISFYELNDAGKIIYVRDIPESVTKPPPLQAHHGTEWYR